MINDYALDLKSTVQGISWPAIPGPEAASSAAVLYQLQLSQWWPPEDMLATQLKQLESLVNHAAQTIPYYSLQYFDQANIKPGTPITLDQWQSLPLLERAQVQSSGSELKSTHPPKYHGALSEIHTSGSTGTPIVAVITGINRFLWHIFSLRDHCWFQRNLDGKLAAIRAELTTEPGIPSTSANWGPATGHLVNNGPCVMMNVRTSIAEQAAWLVQENPDYLLSHPSNLLALARRFRSENLKLPKLKEVRAYGETASVELRELCQSVWGAPLADMYSAQEVGYIALQCPESGHYHIQSENLLVEILNDDGQPCAEDETGRVVITTLQNYAMPLFRYAIGDYAQAGGTCACGRGLPVIKKILGRHRNMITLPDGSQHWPSFPSEDWMNIAPIKQIQLVQKTHELIEARLVTENKMTAPQKKQFTKYLQGRFGYPFTVEFQFLDHLERSASGKFEDFVSEL